MTDPSRQPPSPSQLVLDFPNPGQRIEHAYRELHLTQHGTAEQKAVLGPLEALPRPWDPASVKEPRQRRELWAWLEAFVSWLNHEHTWDVGAVIPLCWPLHPHLVHEIAVLADQRRRAGKALTSDALEEWHRYALPAFVDRMKLRLKSHCEERHQEWPGRARHTRHVSDEQRHRRERLYLQDEATRRSTGPEPPSTGPRLQLVDRETGEVHD